MSEFYISQFDYGTTLISSIYDNGVLVNLSGCTTTYFAFKNPLGIYYSASGQLYTDGTDGKLKYTFSSGELSLGGVWQFQNYIVNASGAWTTSSASFKVNKNLNT